MWSFSTGRRAGAPGPTTLVSHAHALVYYLPAATYTIPESLRIADIHTRAKRRASLFTSQLNLLSNRAGELSCLCEAAAGELLLKMDPYRQVHEKIVRNLPKNITRKLLNKLVR